MGYFNNKSTINKWDPTGTQHLPTATVASTATKLYNPIHRKSLHHEQLYKAQHLHGISSDSGIAPYPTIILHHCQVTEKQTKTTTSTVLKQGPFSPFESNTMEKKENAGGC